MATSFTFIKKTGSEILDLATDFAQLRITVFREFPYLYDGTMAYELQYIQTYASCEHAFLFAIYDGEKMIGATTCIPLVYETENVKKPFLDNHLAVESYMYFGESLLLKPYRGQGFGHRFFDEREAFAASFKEIENTAFCAVDRPGNHPLKPDDYLSNHTFWSKRGYQQQNHMRCTMEWQDLTEEQESEKTLTFWTKSLSHENNDR